MYRQCLYASHEVPLLFTDVVCVRILCSVFFRTSFFRESSKFVSWVFLVSPFLENKMLMDSVVNGVVAALSLNEYPGETKLIRCLT